MGIEQALYARLTADSNVTALVANRIYPRELPHNQPLPAIVYRRITTTLEHAMGRTPELRVATLQINCFGDEARDADNLGDAVKKSLVRGGGTWASVVVQDMFLDDENDLYEPNSDKHGRALDYNCWYEEP